MTIESERLQTEIDALNAEIDRQPQASDARADVEEPNRPRLSALVSQQNALLQRARELDVDKALKTGGAQLVTPAEPASSESGTSGSAGSRGTASGSPSSRPSGA